LGKGVYEKFKRIMSGNKFASFIDSWSHTKKLGRKTILYELSKKRKRGGWKQ